MLTTHSAPLVLTLRGPQLSSAAVAQIAGQIAANGAAPHVALILECHELSSVTPAGLRALFALRDRHPDRTWVLSAASRVLLRAALQTDMAERFEFWVSTDGARARLEESARCTP